MEATILVDRGPEMQSYGPRPMDIDVSKVRGTAGGHEKNTMKVMRSLWSFAIEGAVEYARIFYDLFLPKANINFAVVSGEDNYEELFDITETQDLRKLLSKLALLNGNQSSSSKHTKSNSEWQEKRFAFGMERVLARRQKMGTLAARSFIILITSLSSDNIVSFPERLQSMVKKLLDEGNNAQILCINIYRQSHLSLSSKTLDVSRQLKFESVAYDQIFSHMCRLVQNQYNLQRTTITGIPMKEEQQAGASANYDVDLLHESNAYLSSEARGGQLVLKWSAPRNPSLDVQQCPAVVKVTPVDVISRHATCLIQFLLHGRAVLLESKHSHKSVQYALVCHGGTVHLHCYISASVRSHLEDPPSISEGFGGRVTDYRIKDFGDLMKSSLLVSLPASKSKRPMTAALQRLEKVTRFWPLVLGETVMFNLTYELEPLLSLIQQDSLSSEGVSECIKVIHQLKYKEENNEPLSITGMTIRSKGPRREELYRQLWDELNFFLEGLSGLSPNHNKVHARLKEIRPPVESIDRMMGIPDDVQSFIQLHSSRQTADDDELNPPKKMRLSSNQKRGGGGGGGLPFPVTGSSQSFSLFDLFKRKEEVVACQRGGRHDKFSVQFYQATVILLACSSVQCSPLRSSSSNSTAAACFVFRLFCCFLCPLSVSRILQEHAIEKHMQVNTSDFLLGAFSLHPSAIGRA
ncbi:integrator complex subunit 13-like isoform X3 [Oscarella lobularis]|uniref:integrator complex subunit 13-like isoform X3 n=1 Tax=Oscarella lobularis TaxID=121494 RepID=UPI00331415CD